MRAILPMLLAALFAEPALAQTPVSIDTPLNVKKPCRVVDDDGEVGDYTLVRCPGLGGSRVYTEASPANVKLSIRWGGKPQAGHVANGYSLGDKLEWRGVRDKSGFRPYAVIVRIIERDHESMDNEGRFKTYNVLGVIRIGNREACPIAAIDEAANPGALELARATADAAAMNFTCGKDKAKIAGKPTKWAQDAIGYDDPPQ